MNAAAVTWTCPHCLVDADEPFCSCCGLDLSQEINRAAEHPGKEVPQPPTEVNAT